MTSKQLRFLEYAARRGVHLAARRRRAMMKMVDGRKAGVIKMTVAVSISFSVTVIFFSSTVDDGNR